MSTVTATEKPKTEDVAPNFKKFGETSYVFSHFNPTYARNCTEGEQKKRLEAIRQIGYAARLVRVSYHGGKRHAYVLYTAGRRKS